jgi:hypothetical protein
MVPIIGTIMPNVRRKLDETKRAFYQIGLILNGIYFEVLNKRGRKKAQKK